MSFLDEVDSLRSKLGFSRINPIALIGIAFISIALVIVACLSAWGLFSSPGLIVDRSEASSNYSDSVDEANDVPAQLIYVHVVGAVEEPGMVELQYGSRVSDAVNAAGGFSSDADQLSVNLARQVSDGEQIAVGSTQASGNDSVPNDSSSGSSPTGAMASGAASSGKVNINTASAEQLTVLKGVGESTAQKIIDYRQQNGSFKSIEDIKNVSGIGEKRYAAIKDSITV